MPRACSGWPRTALNSGGLFSVGGAYATGELYTPDQAALLANISGFSFAFAGPLFQVW
jgi:hypothetical protein